MGRQMRKAHSDRVTKRPNRRRIQQLQLLKNQLLAAPARRASLNRLMKLLRMQLIHRVSVDLCITFPFSSKKKTLQQDSFFISINFPIFSFSSSSDGKVPKVDDKKTLPTKPAFGGSSQASHPPQRKDSTGQKVVESQPIVKSDDAPKSVPIHQAQRTEKTPPAFLGDKQPTR